MTCTECINRCPEHNITYCLTCHKHEGECDYGDCTNRAVKALKHVRGGRLIEIRPFCNKHYESEKTYAYYQD